MSSNRFILLTVIYSRNKIEVDVSKVHLENEEYNLLATTFWKYIDEIEGSLTATKTRHAQYWTFETLPSNLEYLAFDVEQLISKTFPSKSVRINWNE